MYTTYLKNNTSFTDLIGTTEFTYDDIGRLTTTTDPYDFTHEIEYNAESMITSLTADTDERTYSWDTSGRMTNATRNSLTTEYTYNDASWVTRIDYPNSTNTNYTYNSRGWMTAIDLKDSSNNTIFNLPYTYDANGNVTQETIGGDTISYTYDALNRLTFIDRPGTGNDTTYTYDERGNRTEMETGSVTNYLTFNVADRLTRVDKPSNAYDTYSYDYNGNLTQMDRYYPTPLLNSSPQTDKTTENTTENRNSLLMTHYPSDYLPSPENKWDNLSPYLPDLSKIDPMSAKLSQFFPEKAKYDRGQRLRDIASPRPTPDETTSFTYSSDNNMTHADLTDGSDLDFAYDAAGRRLEKKYTKVINNVTNETKYTYHYIGSQITTIDIQGKEDETVVKSDQIRIHLGANSRPISFEYYTDIGTEGQTSATYYYHYDLHGNVIRVTDDAGTTEITYAYDALGTIVSETNTNSIYNPFTWSGEAQIINDPEFDTSAASPKTGLYSSGSGYYNPETGTFLSGTGAPASVNPTSASAEEPTAQSTRPASQLGIHAGIAAVAGGVPVSAAPATSNDVAPEPTADTTPIIGIYGGDLEWSYTSHGQTVAEMQMNNMEWWSGSYNDGRQRNHNTNVYMDKVWLPAHHKYFDYYWGLDEEGRKAEKEKYKDALGSPELAAINEVENWNKIPHDDANNNNIQRKIMDHYNSTHDKKEEEKWFADNLLWAAWGVLKDGYSGPNGQEVKAGGYLLGYQVDGQGPHLFWGPGGPSLSYFPEIGSEFGFWKNPFGQRLGFSTLMRSWISCYKGPMNITMSAINNTGCDINVYISGRVGNQNSTDKSIWIADRGIITIKSDGTLVGIQETNDPQTLYHKNDGKRWYWEWNGNKLYDYEDGTVYVEFIHADGSVDLYRFLGNKKSGFWKNKRAHDINPFMPLP